jgi:SAM-dependent methyltransferase
MTDIGSAFQRPDGQLHADLIACLDYLNGLEFFRRYKAGSWGALRIAPNDLVLDVACGLGFDVIELAQRHSAARFVGVDIGEGFLEIARERAKGLANAEFVRCDSGRLSFAARTFSAARIDRALQHIAQPEATVADMARVVALGGRLVAVEPDWGTFVLYNGAAAPSDAIAKSWVGSFRNPSIGRALGAMFDACGLRDVDCEIFPLHTADLACADKVFDLPRVIANCVSGGVLAEHDAIDWRRDAEDASSRGTFFASLNLVQWVGVVAN